MARSYIRQEMKMVSLQTDDDSNLELRKIASDIVPAVNSTCGWVILQRRTGLSVGVGPIPPPSHNSRKCSCVLAQFLRKNLYR